MPTKTCSARCLCGLLLAVSAGLAVSSSPAMVHARDLATSPAAGVLAADDTSSRATPWQVEDSKHARLIGTRHQGDLAVPGWEDRGGGYFAPPGPVSYLHYTRADTAYLVVIDWDLPREPGSPYTTFLVTDVLVIQPVKEGLSVAFECRPAQENVFEHVFAVVRADMETQDWRDVRKAWKVDLTTGKIAPTETEGIVCINEGFNI